MEFNPIEWLSSAIHSGCWLFLFAKAFTERMAARYPLVYVYFAVAAVVHAVTVIAAYQLGTGHPAYVWIYILTNLPLYLLAIALLLRIYYLPRPPSWRRDWPLVALLPPFAAASLTEPVHLGYRILYVGFLYQFTLAFLAAWRLKYYKNWELGSNQRGLLYGLLTPAALQALNLIANLVGTAWWPYEDFAVALVLTSAISWGIIAHGMRRYDPPRPEKEPEVVDDAEGHRRINRAIQAIRRLLWL